MIVGLTTAKPSCEMKIATAVIMTVNLDRAIIGGKFVFPEEEIWNCVFNMRGSRCKVPCD